MFTMLAFLTACAGGPSDEREKAKDTGETPEVAAGPASIATVDEAIVTLARVTWTTDAATVGFVEFGPDTSYGWSTPTNSVAVAAHEAILFGLTGETTYHFRAVTVGEDGVEVPGPDQTVTTGSIPAEVPTFTEVIPVNSPGLGPWVLTSALDPGGDKGFILVLGLDGKVVWYLATDSGAAASARPTADGAGIYFVTFHEADPTAARLTVMGWDGVVRSELEVPFAHHDAVELPEGGWVTAISEMREVGDETIAGDTIVELALDGSQRVVWSAWDSLRMVENKGWTTSRFPDAIDWTHVNGIEYDPVELAYYVSFYYPECVVKIDRGTGETIWQLGGDDNEFQFIDDDGFGPQHAPQVVPGGLRVFDNNDSTGSRAVEYQIDDVGMTVSMTWSFAPPEKIWALALGDVARYADGSALVTYGSGREIFAVAADGSITGQLEVDQFVALGSSASIADFDRAQ